MNDERLILDLNASFVETGKYLVDDLLEMVQDLPDKRIITVLNNIHVYLDEFDSYGQIVKDVNQDSLSEFNFLQGVVDYFNVAKRGQANSKSRSLCYMKDSEVVEVDSEYQDLFLVPQCLPCMRLIPTLLMDNAFKYCPADLDISINIDTDEFGKTITISNWGPKLEDGEEKTIFSIDQNYRGQWAEKAVGDGHGIGLRLAKLIISAHPWLNAQIKATSSRQMNTFISGIPYSYFSISLYFLNGTDTVDELIDLSLIRKEIAKFIFHEYLRVNPLLSKLVSELSDASFYRYTNSLRDVNLFRNKVFQLKSLIMEHFVKCQVFDSNLTIENDEDKGASAKRFDKQLRSSILEFIRNKGYDISFESQGPGFNLTPMYNSIDLFFYLFSDFVTSCSNPGDLDMFVDREGVEFNFSPNASGWLMDNDRIEIMKGILSRHNMRMKTNTSSISLYRTR
jgi:hypothetical protein